MCREQRSGKRDLKHKLKRILRECWARLLTHSGLHLLVDRLMPRRMLILGGHCVEHAECNASLPSDMKISRARLAAILARLGRRYDLTTVGAGLQSLGSGRGRSLVALTMDDGYRDNVQVLLPLLEELGASATIFIESAALDERRVNWTHKYFWLLDRMEPGVFAAEFAASCTDEPLGAQLVQAAGGERATYQMKRALKYDADQEQRDRVLDELFVARGGDEGALCERLYLTWEDARVLHGAGIEIGGHTVTHPVLAGLDPERQAAELVGSRQALERGLGVQVRAMAYPFGRRWDFDDNAVVAVAAAGYTCSVTTHAGTVGPDSDPFQLKRWMVVEGTGMHLLVAEACGGFDLLRRLGLDLSE